MKYEIIYGMMNENGSGDYFSEKEFDTIEQAKEYLDSFFIDYTVRTRKDFVGFRKNCTIDIMIVDTESGYSYESIQIDYYGNVSKTY